MYVTHSNEKLCADFINRDPMTKIDCSDNLTKHVILNNQNNKQGVLQ